MNDVIDELLARCGPPRLIIENLNRSPSKGRPDLQVKSGSSEFLVVKARQMTPLERLPDTLRRLTSQGLSAVQVTSAGDLSAVITTADVAPLSREDFRGFVREGRVVSVGSFRMMGDEYDVSLRVVKQVHGATINECFLFESSASFSVGGVDDCTAAALVERLLSSLDRW